MSSTACRRRTISIPNLQPYNSKRSDRCCFSFTMQLTARSDSALLGEVTKNLFSVIRFQSRDFTCLMQIAAVAETSLTVHRSMVMTTKPDQCSRTLAFVCDFQGWTGIHAITCRQITIKSASITSTNFTFLDEPIIDFLKFLLRQATFSVQAPAHR